MPEQSAHRPNRLQFVNRVTGSIRMVRFGSPELHALKAERHPLRTHEDLWEQLHQVPPTTTKKGRPKMKDTSQDFDHGFDAGWKARQEAERQKEPKALTLADIRAGRVGTEELITRKAEVDALLAKEGRS